MKKMILSWILSYKVGQLRYFAAKAYLETLAQLHRSATLVFGVVFLVALFMSGFILITFGVVMIIPVSAEIRGIIMLSVGALAIAVSVFGYFCLNSERRWIRFFRVDSVLQSISGKKSRPNHV